MELIKNLVHQNIQQNKNFNIICVGSISVRKGIIYLIKAFNELNLANSNLTLIGDMERGFENRNSIA